MQWSWSLQQASRSSQGSSLHSRSTPHCRTCRTRAQLLQESPCSSNAQMNPPVNLLGFMCASHFQSETIRGGGRLGDGDGALLLIEQRRHVLFPSGCGCCAAGGPPKRMAASSPHQTLGQDRGWSACTSSGGAGVAAHTSEEHERVTARTAWPPPVDAPASGDGALRLTFSR